MRHCNPHRLPRQRNQQGAALVVGLVLLFILTVVTMSGMQSSTLELQMAGNSQFEQNAFQAAETGLERAMAGAALVTAPQVGTHDLPNSDDVAQTTVTWLGATQNLAGGNSIGTGFAAHHFEAVSIGTSARGASATTRQGFFIVGPDGG